jgi:hypothetical protein
MIWFFGEDVGLILKQECVMKQQSRTEWKLNSKPTKKNALFKSGDFSFFAILVILFVFKI